ncbi:hypothetical protein TCON_0273 [Astathelohania contejeani]|uniref:Uncharacterized protein n=1 Tax=Astathelohania contejeani TaxID=164912 RepID=A0ABQ7I245_9MICR|nr:hypothetical protein TCON_0273 [Thelohania contejeani]
MVSNELLTKVGRLCNSKLNVKILFRAIYEHAISLVNYHTGLQHLEPYNFVTPDYDICKALVKYKVDLRPDCLERLYLFRTKLERGLHGVKMKNECLFLELWKR